MAMFSQPGSKRQKVVKDTRTSDSTDYFPGISRIEYKGTSASYDDTLCYRYYNAHEVISGRTMEEWLKPAIPLTIFKNIVLNNYGKPTFQKFLNDNTTQNVDYKRNINAAHEFCTKLGIKYWTAFDSDFISDNEVVCDEQNMNYEEALDFIQEIQHKSSMKFLWIAPNFFTNSKFTYGACTSYDAYILLNASRQIKKSLEIAQKVNAEGFLIPSRREGYYSILNTDVQKELSTFARVLKMISNYKDRLGFRGQLLLHSYSNFEPLTMLYSNSDPHNSNNYMTPYLHDPISSTCFLKHYNLERQYKLVTGIKHQLYMSTVYNTVGSIDLNYNETFNLKDAVFLMKYMIENNGYLPGGINLKLLSKRDYMDYKDIFVTYIQHIDMLAKGLRIYTKMIQDQFFTKNIQQRYSTLYTGFGSRLSNGEATLEECEEHLRKHNQHSENAPHSYCEHWEAIFDNFMNSCKLN